MGTQVRHLDITKAAAMHCGNLYSSMFSEITFKMTEGPDK